MVFQCRDEGRLRSPVRWVREGGRSLKPGSVDRNGRLEINQVTVSFPSMQYHCHELQEASMIFTISCDYTFERYICGGVLRSLNLDLSLFITNVLNKKEIWQNHEIASISTSIEPERLVLVMRRCLEKLV